ncbi:glycerate kinase [Streptomyces albipurpureus]|uniref:Glycerate kinase n=1 Tax=Streptomyces albipurpureus TaxID=2897419 RepID=A0ABT0UY50_9ACTN|nr:glycerate kinase [Streptomyces sp. CWNU-1]MCM2393405.1 glycerate kinase [Streptomyces sp. CWNU-1]
MTDAAATQPAHVLVAPDKFKGSLTAVQVAERVSAGLRQVLPGLPVESLPVADGGDGTVAAAIAAGFDRRQTRVTGPLGEPVTAAYALRSGTAVVEMAEASGLRRLPAGVFAPLTATTFGSGELLRAALDAGAGRVILGVGGSATTDGGAGMLAALGARLLNQDGTPIGPGGGALTALTTVDLSGLDPRISQVELILASDVTNPLTGPAGAAAVYGPQKGAAPDEVVELDAALTHFASLLGPGHASTPGAGAAGGVGYAALAALGARVRPGIEVVLEVLGFAEALTRATLVITGEGSLDEQTLHGKAPAGVAAAARARGIAVVAVCGRLTLSPQALAGLGIQRAYSLLELESDPARCMADAGPLLERVAQSIARDCLR